MLGRWESQGCSRGEREPHHHGPLLLVQSPHTQLHYAVVRPLPLYLPSHSGGHHDHFCHAGSASCSAGLGLVLRCAPVLLSLLCWRKTRGYSRWTCLLFRRSDPSVGFENRQWVNVGSRLLTSTEETHGSKNQEKTNIEHPRNGKTTQSAGSPNIAGANERKEQGAKEPRSQRPECGSGLRGEIAAPFSHSLESAAPAPSFQNEESRLGSHPKLNARRTCSKF